MTAGGAIDFVEAWQRWWAGQQVGSLRMWGLLILWWSRIGKLLQFAAGLVVVLDLIGPARLTAAARRLGASDWPKARRRLRSVWGNEDPDGLWVVRTTTTVRYISIVALCAALIYLRVATGSLWWTVFALVMVAALDLMADGALHAAVEFLVFVVLLLVRTGYALGLQVAVSAVGKALGARRQGHPIRWIAFALFVVGFQFDLLGS